jgi:hypothetical protein
MPHFEVFLRAVADGDSLSHIHVQSVPGIHRVEYATEYVLDKYAQSHAVDRRALRYIASFCRLVKASTYYRHRMALSALWNLAASWVLVPRQSLHLIDRFPKDLRVRNPAGEGLGEPAPIQPAMGQ